MSNRKLSRFTRDGGFLANLLANCEGDCITIVGIGAEPGEMLECEGCGESGVAELLETDDGVMLCKPCFEACIEESNG